LKKKYNISAFYIPNGINIPERATYSEGLSDTVNEKFITFAAGRIIEFKGLDILLSALKDIPKPPKLLIIGDLDQEANHKLKIIEMARGLNVEFLGLIKDKNRLFSLIAGSYLFVFPSRQEAMSIMLLEVAMLGVPIIASDIIENKDVFDDSEILFFKNDSPELLKLKIEYALNNPTALKPYSTNAYNKLVNYYLWGNIAQKYSTLYEKLLKK